MNGGRKQFLTALNMSSLLDVIDEECECKECKEINAYCELFEKDKDKGSIQSVAATHRNSC